MLPTDPNLVFDVGACEGNDSDFYLRKGFSVVTIEANPALCVGLQARFAEAIAAGRLTLLNLAVYDESGVRLPVWQTRDPEHGTVGRNPHQVAHSLSVHTIDWADLVRRVGRVPRYCKIDVEGAEEPFLRSMLVAPGRPTYMSVEAHLGDPVAMLFALGYRHFRLINQHLMSFAPIPDPPLEGLYVPETNHMQGSGLFGRELPGARWLDFAETMGLFDAIQRLNQFPELHRSWYDCHAWRPE